MKWTIEKAIACINRNGGTVADKGILLNNPGIRVLGCIDYLVNHCGYHRAREK
jgi:hypothetical protein